REDTEKALLQKLDLRMSLILLTFPVCESLLRSQVIASRLRGFEDDLGMNGPQFAYPYSTLDTSSSDMDLPSRNMLLSQMNRPSIYLSCCLMVSGATTLFYRFFMAQSSISNVVLYAWTSSTVGDPPAKRAVALALMNAIAQSANIVESHLWLKAWGLTCKKSFSICTMAFVAAVCMCLCLREVLTRSNHKTDLEDEEYGVQTSARGWRYHI
ncbi:hypothetical protein AN958_00820, partial [Leucoagaricus sp. SymC.cos]